MTTGDEHALAVLFRQESGRLVAYLTRFFGVQNLDLAEDVAQETLLAALQAWTHGLPPDPAAWLFRVAKNRARDVLRRRQVRRGNGEVALDSEELSVVPADRDPDEDLLAIMFCCCHPRLTDDTQTMLILRLVCGFGTGEVALAFFSDPSAMEKRLVRAKKIVADEGRLCARLSANTLRPLEEQDRSSWDASLLDRGMRHLAASASGIELSALHLEAGIAAQHAVASSVETTDWAEITRLYDLLYARKPTPVVALSRAIARSRVVGARQGIVEVLAIEGRERLDAYPFYWATLGDLALRDGDRLQARKWLSRGLSSARTEREREVFLRRLGDCAGPMS